MTRSRSGAASLPGRGAFRGRGFRLWRTSPLFLLAFAAGRFRRRNIAQGDGVAGLRRFARGLRFGGRRCRIGRGLLGPGRSLCRRARSQCQRRRADKPHAPDFYGCHRPPPLRHFQSARTLFNEATAAAANQDYIARMQRSRKKPQNAARQPLPMPAGGAIFQAYLRFGRSCGCRFGHLL